MVFQFDIKEFWSALSAIGTIMSSLVALGIALYGNRRRLSVTFVWEKGTDYIATIVITNPSSREIVLRKVDFKFEGKMYNGINLVNDSKYKDFLIILPYQSQTINFTMPKEMFNSLVEKERKRYSGVWMTRTNIRDAERQRMLVVVVTDIEGRKYIFRQKLSENDALHLFFGEGLLH